MIKLTEEMVVARTRISDLSNVKKLNCWGADLQDVSLLRRMPNVEVLALSVNQIRSLADFQNCYRLQELYIRKNNIKDLRDVCYLKGLTNLKNLWLADNPCSQEDGYRLAVLRALPQLEKLDDILIKPEETEEAAKKGRDLVLNIKDDDNYGNSDFATSSHESVTSLDSSSVYKEIITRKCSEVNSPNNSLKSSSVAPSPDLLENNPSPLMPEDINVIQSENHRRFSVIAAGVAPQHEKTAYSESAPVSRRSSVAVPFASGPEHVGFNTINLPIEQLSPSKCPIHNQNAFSPIQTSPIAPSPAVLQPDMQSAPSDSKNSFLEQRSYRLAQDMPQCRTSPSNYLPSAYVLQNPLASNYVTSLQGQNAERSSPTRSSGRVRNRASNLLMAALCLVNELDYGSLEVLGVAVRNRLDEFDSN